MSSRRCSSILLASFTTHAESFGRKLRKPKLVKLKTSLFLADKDPRKGVWLESRRPLEYYLLRDGDILEYKQKQRPLKVQTLDASIKTVMIDDSNTVGQLMVTICTRLGIVNHEEYSLVRDVVADDTANQKKGTGTLSRGDTDRKFETLKKKLHTDDELNWLNHGQTLQEQGVEEIETLILRRKYFYSDHNVDSHDPIQLNLLYVQCRDGIIKGQYPVSEKDAIAFSAYQAQIQYGVHNEKKHKRGYLDLKDFLPKEYVKTRGIEKKIFIDHKALGSLDEMEAKSQYVKKCRGLKTYGVTFFLVKEKMQGRNKLVPRLFGVTRECVMRVDERTKDVMKIWPPTSVKRWAASPKSFTLDFGDYQEGFYSVQTTEGEQIAQLIAGYIDIILKMRSAKDSFGPDGDEEAVIEEDSVTPFRAQHMSHFAGSAGQVRQGSVALPGVMGPSGAFPDRYSMGAVQGALHGIKHSNHYHH